MMTFDEIILALLALLGVAGIIRSIKGPTIWDRMLGFNMISSKILMARFIRKRGEGKL